MVPLAIIRSSALWVARTCRLVAQCRKRVAFNVAVAFFLLVEVLGGVRRRLCLTLTFFEFSRRVDDVWTFFFNSSVIIQAPEAQRRVEELSVVLQVQSNSTWTALAKVMSDELVEVLMSLLAVGSGRSSLEPLSCCFSGCRAGDALLWPW